MKYLVMENHTSHSIVMDESGAFHRVANLGYEIGDTITEPVFMKSPEKKKKPNWKKISTVAAIFVCLLLASVPVINSNTESDVLVYMSINPEVHLELNEDGKINKVVADNEDGKVLLDGYKYRGKNATSVLIELIDRAERLEYLSEGGDIRITVKASDNVKAKTVQVDLSEVLKEAYVKKYLIKIKANEEDFRKVDDVLNNVAASTEAVETTAASSMYSEHYSEATTAATESTAVSTTEGSKETVKPTENTKPTAKPTEKPTSATKPTDVTKPSEPITEPQDPTEPSDDEDDPADDEDWEWPWWEYPWYSQ